MTFVTNLDQLKNVKRLVDQYRNLMNQQLPLHKMFKFANVFKHEVLKKRTGLDVKVQENPIYLLLRKALAKEVKDF